MKFAFRAWEILTRKEAEHRGLASKRGVEIPMGLGFMV